VSAGAWLEVMPEPLVPHRGSRYRQMTTIDVEKDGALFFVDQLMPGRVGHGEAWRWTRLCLELTVRVDGERVLRERLDQSGDDLRGLAELAGSGVAACFANAVLIAPETSDGGNPPWRAALAGLHGNGLWLGVSALRRRGWSIKLVAPDAVRLRQSLRDARAILAGYFPRLGCDPRKL
jgi:urease accessory protein